MERKRKNKPQKNNGENFYKYKEVLESLYDIRRSLELEVIIVLFGISETTEQTLK